ncbi:unnamed protein product, partial [Rotaria sp. Silwood1]
MQLAIAATL